MQNMALFARPGIQSRGAEVVRAKQSSMMKMYSDLSSLLMRDCIFFFNSKLLFLRITWRTLFSPKHLRASLFNLAS